ANAVGMGREEAHVIVLGAGVPGRRDQAEQQRGQHPAEANLPGMRGDEASQQIKHPRPLRGSAQLTELERSIELSSAPRAPGLERKCAGWETQRRAPPALNAVVRSAVFSVVARHV